MNPDVMGQMMGGGPAPDDTLGNRMAAPRRAIDKLLMTQQQTQPRTMAFPLGIPNNEQPPNQPQPNANSFLNSVLR